VRKRRHAPLAELLFERVPGGGLRKTAATVALEALRAVARDAAASPGRAPSLRVAPEVAAALDGVARAGRQALEARLGRPLAVTAEPGRPRDAFDIG
jgi:Ribonuclease G/E